MAASSPAPSDTPTPPPSDSTPPPPPKESSAPPPSSPPPPKTSPSPPPPASSPPPEDSPPPKSSPSPPPPPKSNPPSPSPPPQSNTSPPPPSKGGDDSSSPPPPPPSTATPSWSPPPPSVLAPSSNSSSSSKNGPPSSSTSPSKAGSSSSGGSDNSLVIIVGVAAGAALLVLIMTLLFLACSRKKKKQLPYDQSFHGGPSLDSKVGNEYYYYAKPPFQQANNRLKTPPDQHVIKFHSPPAQAATSQSIVPPLRSSSGEVSTNYSGSEVSPRPPMSLGNSKSSFSYEELAIATGAFAKDNILGQGGFGYVFKGVLPDGKEVAVKCLKSGSGQGDREFQAEVEIITRVHHRYLVSLVGYCIAGAQRLLVYEFVPNKTLEYHLHEKDRPVMDWPTRLKIALGSAKGLAYLHEDCHPRIIHRDIKASNILLGYNFEAKVADFGLAKLTSDNSTHVSTRVMGTFGYLAPEYAASGKLSEKSDTFSFGVMLLELITGRRPVDEDNDLMEDSLVDWARPIIDRAVGSGNYNELVDPRLEGKYVHHELASMVVCAGACTRHSARRRPKMSQVVRALEGDVSLDVLNSWNKPIEGGEGGGESSGTTTEQQYSEDLRKFRKMAFGNSQNYASSECGATSEYCLNPSCSSSDPVSQEVRSKKQPN